MRLLNRCSTCFTKCEKYECIFCENEMWQTALVTMPVYLLNGKGEVEGETKTFECQLPEIQDNVFARQEQALQEMTEEDLIMLSGYETVIICSRILQLQRIIEFSNDFVIQIFKNRSRAEHNYLISQLKLNPNAGLLFLENPEIATYLNMEQ